VTTPLYAGAKSTPALDEAGFQQLLKAAYVLQQHNDSLRAKDPRLDTSWVLTRIAETQSLLRAGGLDFAASVRLIAERLQAMTDAAGVSVSLITEGYLYGIAESGVGAKVPGCSIASHSLVATERLKTGRVFRSADAQKDIRLDITACRKIGVLALLAVPIERAGQIAGLVEVRWNKPDAFHECDVRTCQMMAALVVEMLETRGAENGAISRPPAVPVGAAASEAVGASESVAAAEENSTEVPDDGPASPPVTPPASPQVTDSAPANSASSPEQPGDALAAQCRVCGRPFTANEAFCGNCSMPRVAGTAAEGLQSKWASLWYMQQAQAGPDEMEAPVEAPSANRELQSGDRDAKSGADGLDQPHSLWRPAEKQVFSPPATPELLLLPEAVAPPSWDDVILAWWERCVKVARKVGRRGATALAALLALFLLAVAWGSRPSPGWPGVTRFESVMVKLGLVQVPQRTAAPSKGNPDLQVWLDVHTALYYCPGSELYGHTLGGQFATQRDAQLSQFKPATGAVCE